MRHLVETLSPRVRTVAEALQRLAQLASGQMPVEMPLAEEDECVFDAAVTAARAVIEALDTLPVAPRERGPLKAADAQALRLDLGAHAIAIVAWMPGDGPTNAAMAALGNRAATGPCSHAQSLDLAAYFAGLLFPASPASPASPSSTPETQS